jgi:hypothetical protein
MWVFAQVCDFGMARALSIDTAPELALWTDLRRVEVVPGTGADLCAPGPLHDGKGRVVDRMHCGSAYH